MTGAELRAAAGHYQWLEERLFVVLGGWVPSVTEPEVKLALRRHSFQHAWHAELWAGLRPVGADRLTPADDALGAVLDAVAAPAGTAARLAGAYGVVLPGLVSAYRHLAEGLTAVADGPVVRVLGLVLADDEPALAEGEALWRGLAGEAGDHRASIGRWLAEIGGVKPTGMC